MDEAMGWITDFLKANPTETVIFQVNKGADGDECIKKTYEYLRTMAQQKKSYIWAGDHVPTLEEVRGKILIISRLDLEKLGGAKKGYTYDITVNGKPALWALDCSGWVESEDYATGLAAGGYDFQVWTQDDYGHSAGTKKEYIKYTLLGKGNHKNSTLDRYVDAKLAGKHAWVFNYTSTSNGKRHVPFDLCKEIHQWLYDHSEYDDSNRLVCGDTFTGLMCFDFIDEKMASFIYKTNFRKQYTTIHGVSPDGEELVSPLTLYVGESENATKLLNETSTNILKKFFDVEPYGMMTAANGSYLSDEVVTNQEELDSAAARVSATLSEGTVPEDLYVILMNPINEASLDVSMPVCGTAVSGTDPQVTAEISGAAGCEVTNAYITQTDSDTVFVGTVEGGKDMPVQITFTPKWGYYFPDNCTVKCGSLKNINSEVISGGQLKVKASVQIPHEASPVSETPASCTVDGAIGHYKCNHCPALFLGKRAADGTVVLVDASEDEVTVPKLGHEWGDWEVSTPATQTNEGVLTRECNRGGCDVVETLPIPKTDHQHGLTRVAAKEAEKCTENGNIEYWVCDSGENPCHNYFADAQATTQISESDTITGPGEHHWGEVEYLEGMYGAYTVVTAVRECENDGCSYDEAETVVASVDRLEPTCLEDGYLHTDAEFENEAFDEYYNEIIYPALDHEWDEGKVTKAPTCSSEGGRLFTCKRCGEIRTEEIAIDPNAHSIITEVDKSTNTATCTDEGRATAYEVCSICDEVVNTKRINTPPLDHGWETPTYVWSDDNSSVTATRSCDRDGCGEEETETVSTTMRVLEESSYETPGLVVYDATFTNEEFDTQEKMETIPKMINIKDAGVSGIKAKTWTGKALKQSPVVKVSGKTLKSGTNYTVTYKNNKNVGKATVTIKGKGNYTGTLTKTFKINPKGTSLKKLKKGKKTITVKWKKQAKKMSKARITGYQIQLATNKKFTKDKKLVTVKGYKKVSKKVTKLKGKKKYYVRVRTYKTIKGVKYYSPWSKVKTVKTR